MPPRRSAAPAGAVERALRQTLVTTQLQIAERQRREAQVALEEMEVQYHVAIAGTAAPVVGFTLVEIEFDADFFYAPGQRDSDLARPTLSVGGEADANVAFTATVREWTIDTDNGAITGALVAIGFAASGTATTFSGHVHLTFQGWGAVREVDADLG